LIPTLSYISHHISEGITGYIHENEEIKYCSEDRKWIVDVESSDLFNQDVKLYEKGLESEEVEDYMKKYELMKDDPEDYVITTLLGWYFIFFLNYYLSFIFHFLFFLFF
jgi:hypothetical protein